MILIGSAALLTSILLGFFRIIAKIQNTLDFTELYRKNRDHVTENSTISASRTLSMTEMDRTNLCITFEKVSFTYPGREKTVLEDISFTIRQGEKIGLSEKIAVLPNGVHTSIYKTLDDSGIEFSGGESQKLTLTRAIYKDAEILILDEPTSALDLLAEHELFSRLSDIAGEKTTLFISHLLSSTRFCDRILILSDGKIAEIGTADAEKWNLCRFIRHAGKIL